MKPVYTDTLVNKHKQHYCKKLIEKNIEWKDDI